MTATHPQLTEWNLANASSNRVFRYAYLKFGNAVEEARRLGPVPTDIPDGGPDAYLAHFLKVAAGQRALVVSIHFGAGSANLTVTDKDESVSLGNVVVRSYYWYSRLFLRLGKIGARPLGTLFTRTWTSVKIFYHLVAFRPHRVVCGLMGFPLWAAFLCARLLSIPLICSRHTRLVTSSEHWYRRAVAIVDARIMRRAAAVLCHGPYLRQQVIELGIPPERVIDFAWGFRDMQRSRGMTHWNLNGGGKYKVVLFLGRMERTKGIFDLLAACEPTLRSNPTVRLVYAGNGNYLDELRAEVAHRSLTGAVMLLGMVPHDQLPDVISQSHVVVTPTQTVFPEGRCMATVEGLCMGVPVVAPDFGPFPYVVEHESNGLLYVPDSIQDLSEKISRVLYDADLHARLSAGARESSQRLRDTSVSFSQALKLAFAIDSA